MYTKKAFQVALLGAASGLCFAATPANALTYVGSWEVGQSGAPIWSDGQFSPNGPLAYTGQEAAALLFGGIASDYRISTVPDIASINDSAWYSVWGARGQIFADDYVSKYLGQYYGPQSGGDGTASAYVIDNCGPMFVPGACGTNYAFRVPGPLPILGIGAAFGFSRKLRKRINYSKLPAATLD
jgi:hypothetical protein